MTTAHSEASKLPKEIETFLESNGYLHGKFLNDGRIACISPLIFTAGIITMVPRTMLFRYDDRWCYKSIEAARSALDNWNGEGEPAGWHRHPTSGRRRPDGDPLQEYINP